MRKKDYQKPTTMVVQLKQQCHILSSSNYEATGTRINAMEDETDL